MDQFYKSIQEFKPAYFNVTNIVLSLSRLIDAGYSKYVEMYLGGKKVNLELLRGNIELEMEEQRLIESVNAKNIKCVSERRDYLWDSCIVGKFDGKEIYTNKQIKEMAKRIWSPINKDDYGF